MSKGVGLGCQPSYSTARVRLVGTLEVVVGSVAAIGVGAGKGTDQRVKVVKDEWKEKRRWT